jgi:CheY-like chemotaxis protein
VHGARVLVVDDSTSVRKVLEHLLASKGLIVRSADSGTAGLEAIETHSPQLVIADIVMPDIMKESPLYQHIPVILISGIINDSVLSQAKAAGAFEVISKPFTTEDLFPKIERALQAYVPPAETAAAITSDPAVPPPISPPTLQMPQAETVELPPVLSKAIPAPSMPPTTLHLEQGPLTLEQVLGTLLEKPEVEGLLIVDSRGKLDSVMGSVEEPEITATYIKTLLSISDVLGERHQFSLLQALSLEYLGKSLSVHRISETHTLVLIMRGSGGPGVIRHFVLKHLPEIRTALT